MASNRPQAKFAGMRSLTDADIENLRANQQNVFYEVNYKELDAKDRISVAEVREIVEGVKLLSAKYTAEYPSEDVDAIRTRIKAADPRYRTFADLTHPDLFVTVTTVDRSQRDDAVVARLMEIRAAVESGIISQQKAEEQVGAFLTSQCIAKQ